MVHLLPHAPQLNLSLDRLVEHATYAVLVVVTVPVAVSVSVDVTVGVTVVLGVTVVTGVLVTVGVVVIELVVVAVTVCGVSIQEQNVLATAFASEERTESSLESRFGALVVVLEVVEVDVVFEVLVDVFVLVVVFLVVVVRWPLCINAV